MSTYFDILIVIVIVITHVVYCSDFMATLIGRSEVSRTKTRAVAMAQFSLYHSSLSYKITYEK